MKEEKTFYGQINGREFVDVDEFFNALNEVGSNDGNISVQYQITTTNKEEQQEQNPCVAPALEVQYNLVNNQPIQTEKTVSSILRDFVDRIKSAEDIVINADVTDELLQELSDLIDNAEDREKASEHLKILADEQAELCNNLDEFGEKIDSIMEQEADIRYEISQKQQLIANMQQEISAIEKDIESLTAQEDSLGQKISKLNTVYNEWTQLCDYLYELHSQKCRELTQKDKQAHQAKTNKPSTVGSFWEKQIPSYYIDFLKELFK